MSGTSSATSLKKIAAAMTSGQSTPASGVPAGYTYLGQFVDHDLTIDRTAVMLGQNVIAAQMLQGRSPRLDLDSLYGAGPHDPGSAKFYEADGLHLKVGNAIARAARRRSRVTTSRAGRRARP